jgi:hypothetical protein
MQLRCLTTTKRPHANNVSEIKKFTDVAISRLLPFAASQVRALWDATGGLWAKGALLGKPVSAFCSTGTQVGPGALCFAATHRPVWLEVCMACGQLLLHSPTSCAA